MTMLSSSYVIILDLSINAPGHENNIVDGFNATDKHYLKGEMELMGKLASKDTQILGCFPVLQNMSSLDLHINVYIFSTQLYYLFLGILNPKNKLISLYMEEFIIENNLKFLVVTIIGF